MEYLPCYYRKHFSGNSAFNTAIPSGEVGGYVKDF